MCIEPIRSSLLLNEVLEIDQRAGDAWGVVVDQCNLAGAMMQAGRTPEAWKMLRDHAEDVLELEDAELTVTVLELFSKSLAELGDAPAAARLIGASQGMRARSELPIALPDAAILAVSIDKVCDLPDPATWLANVTLGRTYTAEQAIMDAVAAR